jgi:hypothetical protein
MSSSGIVHKTISKNLEGLSGPGDKPSDVDTLGGCVRLPNVGVSNAMVINLPSKAASLC